MNKNIERMSNRNCQRLNTNDDAIPVAVAGVVGVRLEDTAEVRDEVVVELELGTPEVLLIAPVVLDPLRVVGEAPFNAVKGCVSVAAALANEAK